MLLGKDQFSCLINTKKVQLATNIDLYTVNLKYLLGSRDLNGIIFSHQTWVQFGEKPMHLI